MVLCQLNNACFNLLVINIAIWYIKSRRKIWWYLLFYEVSIRPYYMQIFNTTWTKQYLNNLFTPPVNCFQVHSPPNLLQCFSLSSVNLKNVPPPSPSIFISMLFLKFWKSSSCNWLFKLHEWFILCWNH